MAKTKSKKAPGKLSKVLRAFNPRSFRGGMALFALVFALTGGGYMLYRSFAASGGVTIPATNLKLEGGAKLVGEATAPSKKNHIVAELLVYERTSPEDLVRTYLLDTNQQRQFYGRKARACAIVRKMSTSYDASVLLELIGNNYILSPVNSNKIKITSANDYQTVCTSYTTTPLSTAETGTLYVRARGSGLSSTGKIRVSSLIIQYQ